MHAPQTQAIAILCSQLFVQSISPKALNAKRNSSVVVHFNRSTRDNPTLPTEQYWRIVEVTPLLLAAALGTVGHVAYLSPHSSGFHIALLLP